MLDGKKAYIPFSTLTRLGHILQSLNPSPLPHYHHSPFTTPTMGVAGRCRRQHPWASSISMECVHLSIAGSIRDKDDRCASSEDTSQTSPLLFSVWMDGWLWGRRPETPQGQPFPAMVRHHESVNGSHTAQRAASQRCEHASYTHSRSRTHTHTMIRGSYQRHPGGRNGQNLDTREMHPALEASAGHVWTLEWSS